jgi:hypothetical protein
MSSSVVESSQLHCRGRGGDLANADIVAPAGPEGMIAQDTFLKPKPLSVETAKASANKAAKKRKRKREKKPYRRNKKPLDMPIRPLTAYNFFFREQREFILDERDREEEAAEASGIDINASSATGKSLFESMGKDIASRWKALSEQGHEKYTKLAEEDIERYKTEMADYSNSQKAILRLGIDKESQQEKAKSPLTTPTHEDTGPAQNHAQLKEAVALPLTTGLAAENERNCGRMNGMRRKFTNLLEYLSNPFSTVPPPPQDEDISAAKKPRLEASIAADADAEEDTFFDAQTTDTLTAPPDATVAAAPTDTVTFAATSLPSSKASRTPAPPRKWEPEEDAKLTEAVKKHGNDWILVADLVPNRSNLQCRNRWVGSLDLAILEQKTAHEKVGRRWTPAEDAKLIEAVKKLGEDWTAAAVLVPGRTKAQCCARWVDTLDPSINSGKWTLEEDAKLTEAVKEHGKKWVAVAAMVPGRTNVRCRARWVLTLDPDINTGKWTVEEDAKLADALKECGSSNWAAVAALVPGRTYKQCRIRGIIKHWD